MVRLIHKAKYKFSKIVRERFLNFCFDCFGYVSSKIRKERGFKTIVYHGVSQNEASKFNSRFVTAQQFEEHLILIKKLYNPISFEDYRLKKFSHDKLNVLLTFDDGLLNNYTNALPLLQKHQVPAMFFISALSVVGQEFLFNDLLDVFSVLGPQQIEIKGQQFSKQKKGIHFRYLNANNCSLAEHFHSLNANERNGVIDELFKIVPPLQFNEHKEYMELMSKNEIKQLAISRGISIGSHGITHVDLSLIDKVELKNELEKSKSFLEETTSITCSALAFPYGNFNSNDIELFKKSGYDFLFGSEKINVKEDRNFIIERFTINPYVSAINQMYYIAKGNYN